MGGEVHQNGPGGDTSCPAFLHHRRVRWPDGVGSGKPVRQQYGITFCIDI